MSSALCSLVHMTGDLVDKALFAHGSHCRWTYRAASHQMNKRRFAARRCRRSARTVTAAACRVSSHVSSCRR